MVDIAKQAATQCDTNLYELNKTAVLQTSQCVCVYV